MFLLRKLKSTTAKAMPEPKPATEPKSLSVSESSTTAPADELFRPYPHHDEFDQFTLDEGVEVLVQNDGSVKLDEGYSDRRVVFILREYIHGKIMLEDAKRTFLECLPDGNGSGSFGSCMLHTASQIPYAHPTGQARLVQLLRTVYNSLGPGSLSQFGIEVYENFGPDLDYEDENERPVPGDSFRISLNMGAFYARLSQNGIFNMDTYGIRTMRRLEETEFDDGAYRYTDCNVSLAALWVILAGQRMYTEVVEAYVPQLKPGGEKRNALHDTGPLYKGPISGKERWAFWRDALKAAAERENGSDESRRLAKNAAEVMDVIERSFQF
ncbi:hypothetical protein V8F33_004638 [Rhypophila sp. PSN 637]